MQRIVTGRVSTVFPLIMQRMQRMQSAQPRAYHTNPELNHFLLPKCADCISYKDNGKFGKPEPWCALFKNRAATECRAAEGMCGASGRYFEKRPTEDLSADSLSTEYYASRPAIRSLYPAAWIMNGFITEAEYYAHVAFMHDCERDLE